MGFVFQRVHFPTVLVCLLRIVLLFFGSPGRDSLHFFIFARLFFFFNNSAGARDIITPSRCVFLHYQHGKFSFVFPYTAGKSAVAVVGVCSLFYMGNRDKLEGKCVRFLRW